MPKRQAVVIQPKAGLYYANVSEFADSIKSAVKDIGETLVLDLKYSPYLDSTAARSILDSLVESLQAFNNIVVSNCSEDVKKDLVRYASSETHKAMLGFLKIINRDF